MSHAIIMHVVKLAERWRTIEGRCSHFNNGPGEADAAILWGGEALIGALGGGSSWGTAEGAVCNGGELDRNTIGALWPYNKNEYMTVLYCSMTGY